MRCTRATRRFRHAPAARPSVGAVPSVDSPRALVIRQPRVNSDRTRELHITSEGGPRNGARPYDFRVGSCTSFQQLNTAGRRQLRDWRSIFVVTSRTNGKLAVTSSAVNAHDIMVVLRQGDVPGAGSLAFSRASCNQRAVPRPQREADSGNPAFARFSTMDRSLSSLPS